MSMNTTSQKRRNTRVFTLTVISILFSITSSSQENFIAGYIINLKGDTINGYIDYRNWNINPHKISFVEKIGNKPKVYNPLDIIEFIVLDENYVSGIVETEISSVDISRLLLDPSLHLKKDTTFLQTLFKGNKHLYYYNNADSRENFYIKNDEHFELLVYKKYSKRFQEEYQGTSFEKMGKTVIMENLKYIGQLKIYFNDCLNLTPKIQNTKYNKLSLEKLFSDYYDCSNSKPIFQKKVEKITFDIGILAGASISSLEFSGENYNYLINANFKGSANFSAGLFFEAILPRHQYKWSVNNELLFTSYSFKSYYEDYTSENQYTLSTTEINFSYLKLNNLVRYKYPVNNFNAFINIGISNGLIIHETNRLKADTKYYSIETSTNDKAIPESQKYEFGYIFGLGTKHKKLSFEIRYEHGNGMYNNKSVKSSTKRFYFLLGYSF